MPYIDQLHRDIIDSGKGNPADAGSLNYVMTKLAIDCLEDPAVLQDSLMQVGDNYLRDKGLRYAHINDVVGALHCAGREFKRRTGIRRFDGLFTQVAENFYDKHAPDYEDRKIRENGDVYPATLLGVGLGQVA